MPGLIERLRARAFRLFTRDFNRNGAKLAIEAADALEKLEAENERLRASEDEAYRIISQTPAPHSWPLWNAMCAWMKAYEEARQALAGGDQ